MARADARDRRGLTMDPRAVERFLYTEAALLDARDYRAWVDLFTDDGRYWVPADNIDDPTQGVSLIFDDKPRLRERLIRGEGRQFWAQQPPSLTTRLVGNVQLDAAGTGNELVVEARFVLCELRRERQHLLSGCYRYRLLAEGAAFRIREKVVLLLDRAGYFGNLGFLP
jgi:benzoate/toluate 1,2-dioxygenase beta subunit